MTKQMTDEEVDAQIRAVERERDTVAREGTITAVVDYLRHTASGYALMRSIKANGARDALYGIADKLEKDWRSVLGSRVAPSEQSSEDK